MRYSANPMKSDTALLLDVNTTGQPSSACETLRPILEPDFTVDVLMQSKQMVTEHFGEFGANLRRRLNPTVIFAVISGMLKETRMILESVKRVTSDVPIILVNESWEPYDVFELLKSGAVIAQSERNQTANRRESLLFRACDEDSSHRPMRRERADSGGNRYRQGVVCSCDSLLQSPR